MARIFLAIVGVLYLVLGLWCAFLPKRASETVGFELLPGSGQSEFLTVYGGLEVGMALIFLCPLLRPHETVFALKACFLIHACLVVFRTVGFFTFEGITSSTYKLAIGEWAIFLVSALFWWKESPAKS